MKQQLGRDAFISVFKDPVYGWNAKIFAPPSKASGLQAILDEIVRVLRSHYDLGDHLSVCGRETCLDCRQTLLQLHELVFRKVPGATGRNPAGALKQACAKIGVRGAACDVAIGAHQPQTDRDVGNGIMPDLLERGIQ